jgi:hypothetical protein
VDEMHCEACGCTWHVPAWMDAAVRREIVGLFRRNDAIRAIRLLREQTGLSLRDAKAVYYHVSKQAGKCHRCGGELLVGGTVACGRCNSINLDL